VATNELVTVKKGAICTRIIQDKHQLTVPRRRLIAFGCRAFSVAGPTVWIGTHHYWLSFVICLSVLVTLSAALRRYC